MGQMKRTEVDNNLNVPDSLPTPVTSKPFTMPTNSKFCSGLSLDRSRYLSNWQLARQRRSGTWSWTVGDQSQQKHGVVGHLGDVGDWWGQAVGSLGQQQRPGLVIRSVTNIDNSSPSRILLCMLLFYVITVNL